MPRVDHNGVVTDPVPDEHAEPMRRSPAVNPAMGSTSNGAPDVMLDDIVATAGHRTSHSQVLQLRELMRQDDSRRDAQRRAAHEQALADQRHAFTTSNDDETLGRRPTTPDQTSEVPPGAAAADLEVLAVADGGVHLTGME
jgi:hypothetical protein